MASGDHQEAIRTLEGRLEIISEQIRSPCQGEDHKQLVKELLKECQDQRSQMETIALDVIDKEGGDISFNRITTQLEQLDELHKGYEAWANGSIGGAPAGSPIAGPASPHGGSASGAFGDAAGADAWESHQSHQSPGTSYLGASTSEGGFDDRPQRHASDATSDAGRRRGKDKKKDKHKKDTKDFGFPANSEGFGAGAGESGGGFGGWPGSGDAEATTGGWASETATGGGGGGWGGGGGAASGGGFEGSAWGAPAHETQPPSFSAAGGGASGSGFGDASGGWGTSPFEESGGSTKPSGGGWGGMDAPSSQGGLGGVDSQLAQLHIKQPFSDIADDLEGFKTHFQRSIAAATGIAPHRIKVKDVRPHVY